MPMIYRKYIHLVYGRTNDMKLIDLTCNKCGAELKVNADLKKCMCQYCGNEMLIDDEVIHHQIDNAYEAGYQAEMGRQQAVVNYHRKAEQEFWDNIRESERKRIENSKEFVEHYEKQKGNKGNYTAKQMIIILIIVLIIVAILPFIIK